LKIEIAEKLTCVRRDNSGWKIDTKYGPAPGKMWMSDVDCKGDESSITDCSHAGWGKSYIRCTQMDYVSIRCTTGE